MGIKMKIKMSQHVIRIQSLLGQTGTCCTHLIVLLKKDYLVNLPVIQ